jgi:hypothetical protein
VRAFGRKINYLEGIYFVMEKIMAGQLDGWTKTNCVFLMEEELREK